MQQPRTALIKCIEEHQWLMISLPVLLHNIQGTIATKKWFAWPPKKHTVCLCAQACLTEHGLYSLPGSSVHGIFQARILEWLPFPSPGIFSTQESNPCLLYLLYWQADSFVSQVLTGFPTHTGCSKYISWMNIYIGWMCLVPLATPRGSAIP